MNAIIVGLGNQAVTDHIPALLRRTDVQIVGLVDTQAEARDRVINLFPELAKVQFEQDIRSLPFEKIDFAVASLPHNHYFEVLDILTKCKIGILKEKPLARNLEEAIKFTSLPGFSDLCFVCTQRRFSNVHKKAFEFIPKIGEPYLFKAEYNLNIDKPDAGWRGDKALAGGGCLLDMGYHIVDQLMWWFGMPRQIFSSISSKAVPDHLDYAEDSATVAFRYLGGLHGQILLSRSTGKKYEGYEIHGSKGHIIGGKKFVELLARNGEVIERFEDTSSDQAMDDQLDFFIQRLRQGQGFADVIQRNLVNMEFIQACYYYAAKLDKEILF